MIADDLFGNYTRSRTAPYDNIYRVTPSDADELPVIASFLYIEDPIQYDQQSDGSAVARKLTLKITTAGDNTITMNVYGGYLLNSLRVKKVWATGTTAKGIMALF